MKHNGKKLRILMVTKSRQNRGSYMRLFPFANMLSEKGCEVTLVFANEFHDSETRISRPTENLTLVSLPSYSDETTAPGIVIRSLQIAMFLVRNLVKRRFDIVHVCSPAFPDTWIASLLAKVANVPLLVDIDDLWGFTAEGGRALPEAAAEEILIRYGVRAADRVLVVSDFLKKRYEGISRNRIELLWNGIEIEKFRERNREGARDRLERALGIGPNVTIVLAVLDGPQLHVVNEAGDMLEEKGEKLALLLPGWLPDVYRSEVGDDFVKEGRNYRLRRMRRDDYLDMLEGSDLILFLMEDTEWERARVVIKVPEFLASGTPLVSSPFGESRTIIDRAGYSELDNSLYTDIDAKSIAEVIEFCIKNSNTVLSLAAKARSFVLENLTWDRLTTNLMVTYSKMATQKSE